MRILTKTDKLKCEHGGEVEVKPESGLVSEDAAVLTVSAVLGASIHGCTMAPPAGPPCTTVIAVIAGIHPGLTVAGSPALRDDLLFLTDGAPPVGRVTAQGKKLLVALMVPAAPNGGAAGGTPLHSKQTSAVRKDGDQAEGAQTPADPRLPLGSFWQIDDQILRTHEALRELGPFQEVELEHGNSVTSAMLVNPRVVQQASLQEPNGSEWRGPVQVKPLGGALNSHEALAMSRVLGRSRWFEALAELGGGIIFGAILTVWRFISDLSRYALGHPDSRRAAGVLLALIREGGQLEKVQYLTRLGSRNLTYNEVIRYVLTVGEHGQRLEVPLQVLRALVDEKGTSDRKSVSVPDPYKEDKLVEEPLDGREPLLWAAAAPLARLLGIGAFPVFIGDESKQEAKTSVYYRGFTQEEYNEFFHALDVVSGKLKSTIFPRDEWFFSQSSSGHWQCPADVPSPIPPQALSRNGTSLGSDTHLPHLIYHTLLDANSPPERNTVVEIHDTNLQTIRRQLGTGFWPPPVELKLDEIVKAGTVGLLIDLIPARALKAVYRHYRGEQWTSLAAFAEAKLAEGALESAGLAYATHEAVEASAHYLARVPEVLGHFFVPGCKLIVRESLVNRKPFIVEGNQQTFSLRRRVMLGVKLGGRDAEVPLLLQLIPIIRFKGDIPEPASTRKPVRRPKR